MTLTKTIKSELRGTVLKHEGQDMAELTETGLLKTAKGLIIRPSAGGTGADLHTGPLAAFTPAERAMYRMDEQPPGHVPEAAVPAAVSASQPGRQGRRRKAATAAQEAAQPVLVKIKVPGVGEIPSQYVHCWKGRGVVVLGMNQFSYMPARAVATESGMQGVVELQGTPGVRYVYAGHEFVDGNGTRNILLLEVPAQNEEDEEDDGQEEQ